MAPCTKNKLFSVLQSRRNDTNGLKFQLRKSSSVAYGQNQTTKVHRSRSNQRPNFIDADETFIDGPIHVAEHILASTFKGEKGVY